MTNCSIHWAGQRVRMFTRGWGCLVIRAGRLRLPLGTVEEGRQVVDWPSMERGRLWLRIGRNSMMLERIMWGIQERRRSIGIRMSLRERLLGTEAHLTGLLKSQSSDV